MFSTLEKIKGRSVAELRDRGRQRINILAERFGLSTLTKLPSDDYLGRRFRLDPDTDLLESFRTRKTAFYRCFNDREATTGLFRARFPIETQELVDRANHIIEGYFDLLGQKDLYLGTPPAWHFDPISGRSAPSVHWSLLEAKNGTAFADKKMIWELNRHQYFVTLGQAFWLTGDEKYAQAFVLHLSDWLTANPPKVGLNWLSSLEIGFRSISWIWAFHFFKDSPEFEPDIFSRMLKYLYLNGKHLETYLSTYSSPNTHLTGEALGLYFLGFFLPDSTEANRWKQLGYDILMRSLDFQVRDDGVYCEQSSHYHRYTAEFYTNLLILRQIEGLEIESKHQEKVEQLFEVLLSFTEPNGETPLFGDDDGGRLYFLNRRNIADFRSTLALGAALFKRGDMKFVAGEASPELLWLLGKDGLETFDDLIPEKPTETVEGYSDSGFYVVRDSWDPESNFLLIDCGEHGFLNCGHAHADALSFVLSFKGKPMFVDSGTYSYESDPAAREVFRSTRAHNCLTVNGASSSVPSGPFSWKSRAVSTLLKWSDDSDLICFQGTHDGFARFGVEYQRKIWFSRRGGPGFFELRDVINSSGYNTYEVNLILSPIFIAEIDNNSVKVFEAENRNTPSLTINTKVIPGNDEAVGCWRIEESFVSQTYGSRVRNQRLVFSVEASGDLEIQNIFS